MSKSQVQVRIQVSPPGMEPETEQTGIYCSALCIYNTGRTCMLKCWNEYYQSPVDVFLSLVSPLLNLKREILNLEFQRLNHLSLLRENLNQPRRSFILVISSIMAIPVLMALLAL